MNKIKKILNKNAEIINYLVVGSLTTLVGLLTYFICVHTFLNANNVIELEIANIISWILSVTFAYITNRIFVFKSQSKRYIKEMIYFFGSRLLTLFMDMGIMFIFVKVLKGSDTIGKLISQIIVIIANYIFSKLLVFKKKAS